MEDSNLKIKALLLLGIEFINMKPNEVVTLILKSLNSNGAIVVDKGGAHVTVSTEFTNITVDFTYFNQIYKFHNIELSPVLPDKNGRPEFIYEFPIVKNKFYDFLKLKKAFGSHYPGESPVDF